MDASSVGHDLSRGVATSSGPSGCPARPRPISWYPGSASGGLGDEGLHRGDGMPDVSGGGDPPLAERRRRTDAGAGNGASSGIGGELAGQPAADIFDESAIAELAAEQDAVSAPF